MSSEIVTSVIFKTNHIVIQCCLSECQTKKSDTPTHT